LAAAGWASCTRPEQLSLDRRVALKVLPFAAVADPKHLQRFRNEALAAASLDHPHVVKVYGVGCERGIHFIAMQFVEGRSLAELIRQRRDGTTEPAIPPKPTGAGDPTRTLATDGTDDAPTGAWEPATPGSGSRTPADAAYVKRVAEWGVQAAEALEHAHALGVVHRDVKPGNLLVDGRGEVYVADFGLAKLASDPGVTGTGDLLGTVRYMSPEQADARHDLVDHRSDVYSLGVTLYELLTLTPAFDGPDRQSILSKVTGSDPVSPRSLERHIPRDLETIVLKAMEKDPSRRYQSAHELADDLKRFLDHRPVRAKPPGVLDRAARWVRRHQAAVAGVAVFVLATVAAVAGSIGWAARDRADRRRDAERRVDDGLAEVDRLYTGGSGGRPGRRPATWNHCWPGA
jgi:eukaryotic-like serine/threonine-protein kinase